MILAHLCPPSRAGSYDSSTVLVAYGALLLAASGHSAEALATWLMVAPKGAVQQLLGMLQPAMLWALLDVLLLRVHRGDLEGHRPLGSFSKADAETPAAEQGQDDGQQGGLVMSLDGDIRVAQLRMGSYLAAAGPEATWRALQYLVRTYEPEAQQRKLRRMMAAGVLPLQVGRTAGTTCRAAAVQVPAGCRRQLPSGQDRPCALGE